MTFPSHSPPPPHPLRSAGAGIDLSIVIPAYNEEKRIVPTLASIAEYLSSSPLRAEILVVDDGSTDGTAAAVSRLGGSVSGLRLLSNERNRGKGYSLRHGVFEAKGRYVLLTDADLSTPIAEIEKLLPALVREGFGAAIGSRAVDPARVEVPQAWLRRTMGKTFNLAVRLLTGLSIGDTQCGFKLLDREAFLPVFRAARVDHFSTDVEILYLAHRRGIRIAEIPVTWRNSPQSRVGFLLDPIRMLWDLVGIVLRHRTSRERVPR